jgi:hypothetical protein
MTETAAWDVMVDELARCRNDPVRFARLFLPAHGEPWARQVEILRSIVRYKTTVVYSGNSIGKSWTMAILVLWWMLTRPDSLVIATGASQTTVGTILWKEIRRALDSAVMPFGGRLSQGIKASPALVEILPGWQALGFSTTSVERASGQHSPNLLVVVDEASGVPDDIWSAIDSLGSSRTAVFGNPIRPDGNFVELINQAEKDRRDGIPDAEAVNAIKISSYESPHATWDKSPWGLADRPWLEGMIRKYGKNSLWVKSHIRAEIPTVSADILIPAGWLEFHRAQRRPDVPWNHPVHRTRRISCDLSEGIGRDSTCVMCRDDWGVLDVALSSGMGLSEAAATICKMADKWAVPEEKVSYDKLGPGKNLPNYLMRWNITKAVGMAGEASPMDKHSFTNIRTEAAMRLRNRLDIDYHPLAHDPHRGQRPFYFAPGSYFERLVEELRPLTYSLAGGRQMRLLTKEDWAAALGRSPDTADSLLQSMMFPLEGQHVA